MRIASAMFVGTPIETIITSPPAPGET
jgi:hypothetical protein